MRSFKGFFIVLAGLFIFITGMSLLIPSRVMVTRAVVINSPADKVFSEISNLSNWKHWQPVFINDSVNIRFDTNENGISNSCSWDSKGKKNNMLVTGTKGHVLQVTLKREGENDVQQTISVLPLADSSQVQVEWNVLIRLKWYPWEKFYGIFIEKITGEGYDAALNSLKTYVENH